jgi:hypothetical protein
VPLGSTDYIQKKLKDKLNEIKESIDIIKSLKNLHDQWTYTYYTLPGKLTYLYRSIANPQLTIPVAIAFDKARKELVEQFVDSNTNPFQEFQLLLGISSGGFGLHSSPHTCIAASLASSIEYARYKLKSIREACDNPRAWLAEQLQDNNSNTPYIKAIIKEALTFKTNHGDPTSKPAQFFWTTTETTQESNTSETDEDWLVRIFFKDSSSLQHGIYQRLFAITANAQVTQFFNDENVTEASKARFRSGAFEHAGKWLASIPREGFWMSNQEFRTALQLRLGINLGNDDLTCACGQASAQDY